MPCQLSFGVSAQNYSRILLQSSTILQIYSLGNLQPSISVRSGIVSRNRSASCAGEDMQQVSLACEGRNALHFVNYDDPCFNEDDANDAAAASSARDRTLAVQSVSLCIEVSGIQCCSTLE